MEYNALYKGFALGIEKTEYGWQPHVVTTDGVPMSEVAPPLTSPQLVAYAPHLTLEEAQDKACHEATLRADGAVKSCTEAGIEWEKVSK